MNERIFVTLFIIFILVCIIIFWPSRKAEETPSPIPTGEKPASPEEFFLRLSVDSLIAGLQDKSSSLHARKTAASVLGGLKDNRVIEPLITVLRDRSEPVELRCAAAYALKNKNDLRANELLDEIKNNPEEDEKLRKAATPYAELY